MQALLGELSEGQHVAVTMTHERYDVFAVDGPVYWSDTVRNFMVTSLILDSNLKPEKSVLSLTVVDARDPEESGTPSCPASDSLGELVRRIEHGQIVRARFEQRPPWTVPRTERGGGDRGPDCARGGDVVRRHDGSVNHRLVSVDVLGSAAEAGLPVPRRITSWESEPAQ